MNSLTEAKFSPKISWRLSIYYIWVPPQRTWERFQRCITQFCTESQHSGKNLHLVIWQTRNPAIRLGSRIRDMDAESHNWSHFLNLWWAEVALWETEVPKCAFRCFLPLRASTTSEVKNDHTHVITQDIYNKFIEVNYVWDVWFYSQILCSNIERSSYIA